MNNLHKFFLFLQLWKKIIFRTKLQKKALVFLWHQQRCYFLHLWELGQMRISICSIRNSKFPNGIFILFFLQIFFCSFLQYSFSFIKSGRFLFILLWRRFIFIFTCITSIRFCIPMFSICFFFSDSDCFLFYQNGGFLSENYLGQYFKMIINICFVIHMIKYTFF